MTATREMSAKFFAVIVDDDKPTLSLHFKENEGHLLIRLDYNMLDLLAEEILKIRKERKAAG